jgi:hypothetical protein
MMDKVRGEKVRKRDKSETAGYLGGQVSRKVHVGLELGGDGVECRQNPDEREDVPREHHVRLQKLQVAVTSKVSRLQGKARLSDVTGGDEQAAVSAARLSSLFRSGNESRQGECRGLALVVTSRWLGGRAMAILRVVSFAHQVASRRAEDSVPVYDTFSRLSLGEWEPL